MKKFLLFIIIFFASFSGALGIHLLLKKSAWAEWGESELLWDWSYEIWDLNIWLAAAQYSMIVCGLLLAWLVRHWPRRTMFAILTAWSITWIPVALAATHDTLSSPNGPMNLPMTPYLMVLFGFFCLVEALLLALFCRSLEKRRQR